jgi:hypothetical protein
MPSLSSWYVTNGIGEVSERKGVPVRGSHARGFIGVALTYAQVGMKPLLHRARTEQGRTLVSSWYVTNGIGEVSERKGVPVRARRRAAGSKASLRPSPQEPISRTPTAVMPAGSSESR